MITCKFYGGRLAEVMHTIASLFHFVYIKKLNINDVILPLNYNGCDIYKEKYDYIFLDNYPIFKKISQCFKVNLNTHNFRECNITSNWGKFYYKDKMQDDVILSNHWINCIYNTNIYKKLYRQEDLWNAWKNKYKEIYNSNTIGIHIRRGDFCLLINDRDKYPALKNRDILTLDKILNCINNISPYNNIMIFSDDIKWCKENISKKDNLYFIEGNKPYQDLILMSMCDDLMRTPGSTFSKMALSLH